MEFGTGKKASSVPRPRARQELRLALAMRGGVSLAVWIGGAVSEIERLRRAGAGGHDDPVYRSLLDLAAYSTVAVDVLAGASAGGLNAAVYAAAQCHGFDIGKMRDLWTMLGDIETSSRATTSAGRAAENLGGIESEGQRTQRREEALRPPSILDGDGYFYPVLASRLATLIEEGATDRLKDLKEGRTDRAPVEQVSLVLSATLFEPREVRLLLNRHNKVTETGSEALFRFRRGPGQDDLAANGSVEQLAKRLAMAARATSSFPIAFEPANIPVGVHGQDGPGPTARNGAPASLPLAMREGLDYARTFELPGGRPKGIVKVIDGGTLDNIPVTAAVRAIVDSAAQGLTDRWLLYLSPSPPDPTPDRPGTDVGLGSPRAIATTLRTLKARFGVESLLADVRELEAVNRTTCQRRLTMAAAFGGLRSTGPDPVSQLTKARDDRTAELADIWTELDVTAVMDALRKPQGGDALAAGLDVAPLSGWTEEHELGLREALGAVLRTSAPEPWRSPAWLGQLARFLVSWARDLETRVQASDLHATGVLKGRAYRLGTMVAALERAQRLRWLKAAQPGNPPVQPTTVEKWAKDTSAGMLRRVPADFATDMEDVLTSESTKALNQWVDELASNLGKAGDQDLGQALWIAGCQVAQDLTQVGAIAATPTAGTSAAGSEVFALLDRLATPKELKQGLESAVTLCAPLALLGPAPDNEIRFAQLTGNAPTPLDRVFKTLKQDRTKGRGKRKGNPNPDDPLRASDKLCGDELGNFAAFLSAKWRANDWMWGRLDAVATLVDNLLDPERLAELSLASGEEEPFVKSLERLVDQVDEVPAGWDLPPFPRARRDRLAAGPGTDPEGWDDWVQAVRQLRDHVVERLHWEILARELPVVRDAGHGPPAGRAKEQNGDEAAPEPLRPNETRTMVEAYDVGLQGLEDIGDQRRVRLCLRAALVAFGALRPSGDSAASVAGRYAATMLKPLYLIIVFLAASLRRGLFVAAVALGALQATYWRAEKTFHPPGWPSWTLAVLGIAAVAGIAAVVAIRRKTEKLQPLVLAGALTGVALLFGLWSGGGAWASASLLAFGLAAATGVLWRGHRKTAAEKRIGGEPGKVSRGNQLMYASTILIALAGIVAGGLRTMCHSARCDDWPSFRLSFAVLLLAALLVGATGTFWMNGRSRILVLLLVVGAYAGTAAPFARDGWPAWVPVLSSVAAVATAAGLALLAGLDGWRLAQACGMRSRPLRQLGLRPLMAGSLALALSLARVPWPRGAWIVLAVAAAGYSLTVLATYVDVLRPRPNRDESEVRAGIPAPTKRPTAAAATPPAPAEVPAPSVSGPPVATA